MQLPRAAYPQKSMDRRVQHTRSALLGAFRDLLLEDHLLDDIGVAQVAARAGVGRSTLYQHFSGVDGLLSSSIAAPFSVLVETLGPRDNVPDLERLLEHFWERRVLARTLFTGPMRRRCIAVLVGLLEQKLKSLGLSARGALILPPRLAAVQLAEIMLAPTVAWLCGESRCTPAALAGALSKTTTAALGAMRAGV
jgi:AcrR family transcriptional regulator